MAKTTKTQSTVEIVPADNSAAVDTLPTGAENLRLLIVSDRVRANAETKVATLLADNLVALHRVEKLHEKTADEYLRLRRMYPASDEVRALLGEDAIDLIGATDAYRQAVTRMNEVSRDALINGYRREGVSVKSATEMADRKLETFRKSVSRSYRIAVDNWVRKEFGQVEGARFLLAHGFKSNKEVGKGGVLVNGMSLTEDGQLALPAGKAISEDGKSIVDVNLQAEPTEQSDQATPSETADALIRDLTAMAEAHKATQATPIADINLAVGLLNAAAERLTKDTDLKVSLRERNAARKAILGATKAVVAALGGDVETKAETQEVSAK